MIKEIHFSGYSTEPSDYECPDGQLAASLNLISEDNQLKPLFQPAPQFELSAGKSVIYLHSTSAFKHYIIYDSSSGALQWLSHTVVSSAQAKPLTAAYIDTCLAQTSPSHLLHAFGSAVIYSVNSMGNTLVVLASSGMHYILWKGDDAGYLYLGTHIPECDIQFSLTPMRTFTSQSHKVDFSSVSISLGDDAEGGDDKHTLAALRTAKMAAAAQVVAQAAREKLFCFPFFVRYAYRLFDGSNTMQSPPILMLPTTSVAPSLDMGKDFMVKGSRLHGPAEITAAVNAFALYHIAAHSAALDQLAKWKDVVQGIDIFISRQFFTYNQGAPDDQIKPFTATLPEADYASALAENGLFYFLKNIPLDEIYTSASAASASSSSSPSAADASGGRHPSGYGTNLRGCIKPDFDLTNDVIVTRRTLDDDYDSHDTLVPRLFYAFNARANIAAISKRLFRGFPPQCFFFQSDFTGKVHHSGGATGTASATSGHSKGTPVNTSCLVVVETDGREIALPSPSAQVCLDDDRRILWFYYPNPKARRVYFKTGDTVQCLPLTTHSMLNGAFYLNLDKKVVTAPAMPQASPCQESQVEMPGKIYTSEAGNPFYFPVTGINTVGTGTILGLCSAVKALSQGQFGQFPLYAFTTEGVWALELSSTGTYRAIQPVTRDVCINALSITQIDDAVLFATQRGIMLIQGSQAQCITDTVFSQAPFNVLDLPAMSQLHAKLGHMTHDHGLLVKPFLNFLSACRMVYDYVHQHIIVFNPTLGDDRQPLYSYAYVFSLRSKQWGMILSHLVSPVGAYPDAMAMTLEGSLVSFSHMGETASKGLYITRPLKLDAPNVHKTVSALIQRGHFQRGDVSTVLYGSRDLYTWRLVSSSRDHYLRGFRGTPYKYFRIAALASLSVGKSIFGASVQFDPRHTNNLR